jgi:predicted phage-related endonuclease
MLTPENIENRKKIIGGSDAGAILNLEDAFGNAFDVYQRLKNGNKKETNSRIRFGNYAEEFLLKEYELRFNTKVYLSEKTLYHPEHDFIGGHVDGWAYEDGIYSIKNGVPKILIEFKTADSRHGEWGEEHTSDVPLNYLAQVYHYMSLDKDFLKAHIFVLFTDTLLKENWEVKLYEIPRNEKFIDNIIAAEVDFWNSYIVPDVSPPAIGPDQLRQKFNLSDGTAVEADHVRWEQYLQLWSVRESISALEAEEIQLKSLLMETMGNAEILKFHGKTIATWKNHERDYFDAAACKRNFPHLCASFVYKKNQRTFLIKKLGK